MKKNPYSSPNYIRVPGVNNLQISHIVSMLTHNSYDLPINPLLVKNPFFWLYLLTRMDVITLPLKHDYNEAQMLVSLLSVLQETDESFCGLCPKNN